MFHVFLSVLMASQRRQKSHTLRRTELLATAPGPGETPMLARLRAAVVPSADPRVIQIWERLLPAPKALSHFPVAAIL